MPRHITHTNACVIMYLGIFTRGRNRKTFTSTSTSVQRAIISTNTKDLKCTFRAKGQRLKSNPKIFQILCDSHTDIVARENIVTNSARFVTFKI